MIPAAMAGVLGTKYPVLTTTESAMRTNEIVDAYANGELGPEPTKRSGEREGLTHQVRVPQSPVKVRSFGIRGVDGAAWRVLQPLLDSLLVAVNDVAFDLDDSPRDTGLTNRSIIQIFIHYPISISGRPRFPLDSAGTMV